MRSSSTTWRLRVEKITGAAQPDQQSTPKASRWRRFGRRDHRQWITLQVKYAGGSSGWVIVRGRGEVNAYPADTWLLDLVLDVNQSR